MIDGELWGGVVEYIDTGDMLQFDLSYEYTPMAPILYSAAALDNFGFTPYTSLIITLGILDALIISGITLLAYIMRPDNYWYIAVLGLLSFNHLYESATPPSAAASLLGAFLFMLCLYAYERKKPISREFVLLWTFLAGLLLSIRIEIGALIIATCAFLLVSIVGPKRTLLMVGGAVVLLFCLDPFMWTGPFEHISNILSQYIKFHDLGTGGAFYPFNLFSVSVMAFLSMALAIVGILLLPKSEQALPHRLLLVLFGLSVIFYSVLLTSDSQPPRYFLPIVLLWQTLLPAFFIALISKINIVHGKIRSLSRIPEIFVISILFGYELAIFYVLF
ncbi:MAG: hypothetical protein WCV79_00970 [Candidatus Paceibacterota bacterium]|jgi:hypothetical protein